MLLTIDSERSYAGTINTELGSWRLNAWNQVTHRFRNINGIHSGPAKHRYHNRCVGFGMSADPEAHIDPLVLHALRRGGHVFEIDRRTVRLPDDEVVVFGLPWSVDLAAGVETCGEVIELPAPGIVGATFDGGCQIIERSVAHSHSGRISLDPNR